MHQYQERGEETERKTDTKWKDSCKRDMEGVIEQDKVDERYA